MPNLLTEAIAEDDRQAGSYALSFFSEEMVVAETFKVVSVHS